MAYRAMHLLVWISLTVLYRMRIYHGARLPRRGAYLIVANHQSYFDPPAIGLALPQGTQACYLARVSLFRGPFGRLIRFLDAVGIAGDGNDTRAMKEVLRRLEAGQPAVVFPEGSRTEDGAMIPFARGAVLLIKRSRCPVVPVAIEGAFDAWPRARSRPCLFGGRMAVMVGQPIDHDKALAGGPDAAMRRLAEAVDLMRLELRRKLRAQTGGAFPPRGPGDRSLSFPE